MALVPGHGGGLREHVGGRGLGEDRARIAPALPGQHRAVLPVQGGHQRPAYLRHRQGAGGVHGPDHQPQGIHMGAGGHGAAVVPARDEDLHRTLVVDPVSVPELVEKRAQQRRDLPAVPAGGIGVEERRGILVKVLPFESDHGVCSFSFFCPYHISSFTVCQNLRAFFVPGGGGGPRCPGPRGDLPTAASRQRRSEGQFFILCKPILRVT